MLLRKYSAAGVLSVLLFAVPGTGAANTCDVSNHSTAENLIRELHDKVAGKGIKSGTAASNLDAFVRAKVPVDIVSRYALGIHSRRATPSQRTEYQKLFGDTVFPGLTKQILQYRDAAYTIVDNRPLQANDRLVTANVTAGKGNVLKIGWRIRIDGCTATATDMIVDGVSLMVMKRQEFASVISAEGMDGLLRKMRSKAVLIKDGDSSGRKISPSEMGHIMQDLLRGASSKIR
jgi:phospholipid transport system substrate-binding protein